MNHQHANFSETENVGLIDGAVRGSLSIAALLAALLIPAMPASVLIGLTLITIYTGLTAFLGWDPFYALMSKSRPQAPTPSPAAAEREAGGTEQHGGAHKKAA